MGAKNWRKNIHKHPSPTFQIRPGPGDFNKAKKDMQKRASQQTLLNNCVTLSAFVPLLTSQLNSWCGGPKYKPKSIWKVYKIKNLYPKTHLFYKILYRNYYLHTIFYLILVMVPSESWKRGTPKHLYRQCKVILKFELSNNC